MKIAPIVHAIQAAKDSGKDIDFRLIHTGQHYDKNMSDSFFSNWKLLSHITTSAPVEEHRQSKRLPL